MRYKHTECDGVHTFSDGLYNSLKLDKTGLSGMIGNQREGGHIKPYTLLEVMNGKADYDISVHVSENIDITIREIKAIASNLYMAESYKKNPQFFN